MARWSDPDEGLTQDRFRVWSDGDDLYSRAELEENWDTLDAMLGRPVDGVTVWPPLADRGKGKGMWLYFQQLMAERPALGSHKWVWAPTDVALAAIITANQESGYEVANGQTILAADHDLGDVDPALIGQDVDLPDLVDHYIIGVAHNSTVGAEGGITTYNGAANVGTQGAAEFEVTITVPAHTHTLPTHTHSIPAHSHGMNHRHLTLDSAPEHTSQADVGIVYNLRTNAIEGSYPASTWSLLSHPVLHGSCTFPYGDGEITTTSRQPVSYNSPKSSTDVDGSGTTGNNSGSSSTGSDGDGVFTDTVDMRPLSVGMVPFIKVRYSTGL